MIGDAGNDTYIVDNVGDVVDENGALRHRHGPQLDHLQPRRERHRRRRAREPDLTGAGAHQRHRQRSRQPPHRQCRRQQAARQRRRRHRRGRRRRRYARRRRRQRFAHRRRRQRPHQCRQTATTPCSIPASSTARTSSTISTAMRPRRPGRARISTPCSTAWESRPPIAAAASPSRRTAAASTSASTPVALHNGTGIVTVATLHTTDTITVGEDVVVGTS